jgi:hypothetical protein
LLDQEVCERIFEVLPRLEAQTMSLVFALAIGLPLDKYYAETVLRELFATENHSPLLNQLRSRL